MTKRLLSAAAVAAALFIAAPSAAQADTTASFNGCTYHAETYLQAVEAWWAAGEPSCGPGYSTSVSVDTTVSGTVDPPASEPVAAPARSSWGRASRRR